MTIHQQQFIQYIICGYGEAPMAASIIGVSLDVLEFLIRNPHTQNTKHSNTRLTASSFAYTAMGIQDTYNQMKTWNWPLIIRILSIVGGLGTIFSGIFSLVFSFSDFPAALIINLYMMSVKFHVLFLLFEEVVFLDVAQYLLPFPPKRNYVKIQCFFLCHRLDRNSWREKPCGTPKISVSSNISRKRIFLYFVRLFLA